MLINYLKISLRNVWNNKVFSLINIIGLAAFNTEKGTKEIGIRKVMGATVVQITSKLSIYFLKLVCISILVSLPLGWFAMNKWLEDFAYKTALSWWVFALAGCTALGIALLTVSWQSFRAATANPVDALRE